MGVVRHHCHLFPCNLAIDQLTETANTADGTPERTIEFADNRLLIGLCGEYDKNLAQIEQLLSMIHYCHDFSHPYLLCPLLQYRQLKHTGYLTLH